MVPLRAPRRPSPVRWRLRSSRWLPLAPRTGPRRRGSRPRRALADAAGDVGELAAHAAEKADWPVRPDAVSAALLAESAVATAAALVRANLTVLPAGGPSDYVGRAEDDALSAARRALEAV